MEFVAAFEIVSCVVYCDDVAMLTFSRQTLAAAKDTERTRVLEEQVRLRARVRELEESVAFLERRTHEEKTARVHWNKEYYTLLDKYDALRSSGGSSPADEPACAGGAPTFPPLRRSTPSSGTASA